ncbi:MAG: TIGR03905 family TSCPD domain-containing protein [Clostridioides sp.]|jgi:uncharacterized protein (TIGR03905 family)|nr:TIGR03905 family TSCPD domain-containing protein [Clostridioides sp.]
MQRSYKPSGVCCREIKFEIDDNGVITDVDFVGGCAGNLLGLRSLVIGQKAEDVQEKLQGIQCGSKGTSCPDQFSKALQEVLNK